MTIARARKLFGVPPYVFALTLALGAFLLTVAPGSASAGTAIHVSGASASVGQSATANLNVAVAASDSMNAFDITLSFDPAALKATGVALGAGWSQPPLTQAVDNTSGSVHIAAFQFGAGCSGGTSCAAFSVTFQALTAGQTSVHVVAQALAGSNGGSAGVITSVSATDGTITVSGSSQSSSPSPVATSAPTATPTHAAPPTATASPAQPTPTTVPVGAGPAPSATSTSAPTVDPTSAPTAVSAPDNVSTSPAASGSTQDTPAPANTQPAATPPGIATPKPTAAPPVDTSGGATPPAAPGSAGHVGIPKPPATGNGNGVFVSGETPLRSFGIVLIALSALALVAQGARRLSSSAPRASAAAPGEGQARMEEIAEQMLNDAEMRALVADRTEAGAANDPERKDS